MRGVVERDAKGLDVLGGSDSAWHFGEGSERSKRVVTEGIERGVAVCAGPAEVNDCVGGGGLPGSEKQGKSQAQVGAFE